MSERAIRRARVRRAERERRRMSVAKRRGILIAGALSASALLAPSAEAAGTTYQVTTNGDTSLTCNTAVTPVQCDTLRGAIAAANADGGPDTITFASPLSGGQTITVGSPLGINDAGGLTIQGPGAGANAVTVSGNNSTQIFTVAGSSAKPRPANAINGLTITAGNSGSNPGGAIDSGVGGNPAQLTLSNDVISGSTTTATGPVGGGGAVYAYGPLSVSDSTISGNTAPAGVGGSIDMAVHPTGPTTNKYNLSVSDSTLTGNSAVSGGGIAGGLVVTVAGSQITGNHATLSGASNTGEGVGGGIDGKYAGTLVVANSTVSGNTATYAGAGIESTVKYGTTVSDSMISGNTSALFGGGVGIQADFAFPGRFGKYNPIEIKGTTITGNFAPAGAGIGIASYGPTGSDGPGSSVTVDSSTISGNHGLGPSSNGGGLFVLGEVYAPVKVRDSTLSGNTASFGGGVSLGYGKATYPVAPSSGKGSFSFENSTIAGNSATTHGGGIYLGQYTQGSSTTKQSPVAGLDSTIVAGNTAAGVANDLYRSPDSTDGGFNSAFSLIQTPSGAPLLSQQNTILGVNPQLSGLGNHGGATQTMVPAGTSPVIDQGRNNGLRTDQRGGPRTVDSPGVSNPPGGDGTDIGAVELPANAVVPVAGFTASIRGKLITSPTAPLLVPGTTSVTCGVRSGTLNSCIIEIRTKQGTLLGSGEATTTGAHNALLTSVTLTKAGQSALAHNPLGVDAFARAIGDTSRSSTQTVSGKVHLLGNAITLPLGSRSTTLSKHVLGELDQAAKLLSGAKSITCTAYSDRGKNDISVTKGQASAACSRIKHDGFHGKLKAVGKGHSNLIARGSSSKNRRLVLTFKL